MPSEPDQAVPFNNKVLPSIPRVRIESSQPLLEVLSVTSAGDIVAVPVESPKTPAAAPTPVPIKASRARFDWALAFLRLQFFQTVVLIAVEAAIIESIASFAFRGFGPVNGQASLIITYAVLFCLSHISLAILAHDGYVHRSSIALLVVPVLNFVIASYTGVQIYQIRKLEHCAISWISLSTASTNDTQISIDLYNSFSFKQCPTPNGVRVSNTGFNYTAANGSQIQLPILTGIAESSVAIQSAITNLDQRSILLWIQVAIAGILAIVSVVFSVRARMMMRWQQFHQNGASLMKRSMLMRYRLLMVLIKLRFIIMLFTVPQYVIVVFYSSTSDDVTKAFIGSQRSAFSPDSPFYVYHIVFVTVMLSTSVIGPIIASKALKELNKDALGVPIVILIIQNLSVCLGLALVNMDESFYDGRIWLSEFCKASSYAWAV
ncbi:hypothetical protein BC831DRAFT_433364 [Entophlyctis helioformis]|nr:hypothetical protein BC831DRAFT_433364 [Entophlyctis helioformis]